MPIIIDAQLKQDLKKQKLRSLMARFCELEMDKVAHEANGLIEAATSLQKEMDKIQKAYEAIEMMG